jgi:hypothetical protein
MGNAGEEWAEVDRVGSLVVKRNRQGLEAEVH